MQKLFFPLLMHFKLNMCNLFNMKLEKRPGKQKIIKKLDKPNRHLG